MKGELTFLITPEDALDNFSAHQVAIWGHQFPTAEHAYQWRKFIHTHPELAKKIFNARSPFEVKNISDSNKSLVDAEWEDSKIIIMEEIARAKLSQHNDVQQILKKFNSVSITENSPTDQFWGIGMKGEGRNEMGKIWMKLRAELHS